MSVVYSYAVIIEAAKSVQQLYHWQDDTCIKDLMFSSTWVRGFLNRANLRRRKITTDGKKIPAVEEIMRIMEVGQDLIQESGYGPDTIMNMDETALTYAIGPEYMYVPKDQQRAQNIGVPNAKLRITAVVAVFGSGVFAPLFIIIKHTISSLDRPDQSGMKVIRTMHKNNEGFGEKDGWKLILWQKELTIANVTAVHKCYYIIHEKTGEVITSQFKAWNDTVRMIMWLETVCAPLKERLGKLLIWFDNCGCHKTAIVDSIINGLQIHVACLPPNMTGELQVLDLVVNGPLKAHSRKLRGSRIVACFQKFAELYKLESLKPPAEREMLEFEPPKPDMYEGIQDLFDLFNNGFKEKKFAEGVNRSFISSGCLYYLNDDPTIIDFQPYVKHKVSGTMKLVPTGTRPYETTSNAIENSVIVQAMNNYLDYDSENEDAINAILNL